MSPLAALLLLVWPLVAALDAAAESWQTQLTLEQQRELQDRLRALEQEDRIQLGYASQYGQQAVREQEEEFQSRRSHIVERFKAKAAAAAAQSHKGAPQGGAVFLLADSEAGNATGQDAPASADEAWRERLTPKQRQELDHRLSELHKKAAREESLARRDSQRQFQEMREEYVRKESQLLQDFERMADPRSKGHQDSGLEHQLAELRTKAEREEAYAREDGPKELRERQQEYAKKEERLLAKLRQQQDAAEAASREPAEGAPRGGGALLLLAEGEAADASAGPAWRERLTPRQRQELDRELAELHRRAAREQALARRDGDQQLEETRREYARQEARVLRDFERNAERDERAEEEQREHHGLQHELAELRRKAAREEALARMDGPKELRERQQEYTRKEERLLAKIAQQRNASRAADEPAAKDPAAPPADRDHPGAGDGTALTMLAGSEVPAPQADAGAASRAGAGEAWRERLTAKQREELDQRLSELRKKAAKEEALASKDGDRELEGTREEYARKESQLLKAFEHPATPRTGEASGKGPVSGPEHDLAELRQKAAREEAYAREDGPKELPERRQEFARREERLLARLRREQNASEAAPSTALLAAAASASNASSSSESSEREWRQRLSEKQRREMQHRLEDLFRETRVQMGYASEYGPAAVRYQEAEFERKVAKVMAHYKAVAESRSHGEPAAGFLIATLAGHGPLGLLALAAAAGVPAALVALAVGRQRAAAAASLQAPLMSEP